MSTSTSPIAAVTSRQDYNDEFGVWVLTLAAHVGPGPAIECAVALPAEGPTSEALAAGLMTLARRLRGEVS
jgi:hypothetical protein